MEKTFITLSVKLNDRKVVYEKLKINDVIKLDRKENGKGYIFNESSQANTQFEIPNEELFIKRRDKLQYPFLQELYDWAISLVKFRFTYELNKQSFLLINPNLPPAKIDIKDTSKVTYLFREGERKFGEAFKKKIVENFTEIGFPISDVLIESFNPGSPSFEASRCIESQALC